MTFPLSEANNRDRLDRGRCWVLGVFGSVRIDFVFERPQLWKQHCEIISKAAGDIETILLRSLLEPMQKSFSKICGDGEQEGQEDYQYMGSEALASALAASGGLGISQLIAKQLTRVQQKNDK